MTDISIPNLLFCPYCGKVLEIPHERQVSMRCKESGGKCFATIYERVPWSGKLDSKTSDILGFLYSALKRSVWDPIKRGFPGCRIDIVTYITRDGEIVNKYIPGADAIVFLTFIDK